MKFFKKKNKPVEGFKPLTDSELTQILVYLLAKNSKSWFTFAHNNKTDAELIVSFMDNTPLTVIDQMETVEYTLTKDKLKSGFKSVCNLDSRARRDNQPDWRPVNKYAINGYQIADLALQYAILNSTPYTTNMPKTN